MSPPEVMDGISPLSWGWFSIAFEINEGAWMYPTEAAKLLGVTPAQLRHWSDHGLISRIHHHPGDHRRYLKQELVAVLLVCKGKPTMRELVRVLDAMTR